MPSRIFSSEPVQSGLDAFLTGGAEAYTGIKNERRKRQVESQQDAVLRQQMDHADAEQQRRNIEGGYSSIDLRPINQATDQITQATSQASGVRAKIGSILSRAIGGGGAEGLRPTQTLVKTGPSAAESLAQIGETGANTRNAATIASSRELAGLREEGDSSRNRANLDYQYYNADLDHQDRLAAIAAQRARDARVDGREDARDLRDYGRQLNEEIASLTRQAADRNGIMQEIGGAENPTVAYQTRMRAIKSRIGELHAQLNDVNATMSRRAIGSKLAAPAAKKAPVGVPARQPTLEEDILSASRP